MNAGYPLLKARTVLLFAGALVLAGLVSVLYFLALSAWKFVALYKGGSWLPLPARLPFTDHSLQLGLIFALVGVAITGVGILLALRQRGAIRVQKQRNEDRLRRVQDYRRESSRADDVDGRREPFIGSGGFGRNADRRVA